MRGIVSLAAALALPSAFPYRDLIVLTAFSVVLGTLVIQGLTLKPLLRALDLHDDDPVGRELRAARERALMRDWRASRTINRRWRTPSGRSSRQSGTMNNGGADADKATHSLTAKSIGKRWRRRGKRFSPCVPTTKLATTRFIRSKRNWTGSKWQGGAQAEKADASGRPFAFLSVRHKMRARERSPHARGVLKMASVTNYHNDLFISYSHIDNEPFGPQGGWVDIFHAALQNFVNVRVGRRVAVWRDARLSGAEIFSDQIEQELRNSAVLGVHHFAGISAVALVQSGACAFQPNRGRGWPASDWQSSTRREGPAAAGRPRAAAAVTRRRAGDELLPGRRRLRPGARFVARSAAGRAAGIPGESR